MNAPLSTDLMSQLRAATRAEHDAMEAALVLLSPVLSTARYGRHLRDLYGFYRPMEEILVRATDWPRWGLDLEGRRKSAWLAADLQHLGLLKGVGTARRTDLPVLPSVAAAFGCVYVLEGATLGGLVVSRHLERTLGLSASSGARFFHGYGPQTSLQWHRFRAALRAFAIPPGSADETVNAAIQTFQALRRWCARDPDSERDLDSAGDLDSASAKLHEIG